MSVSKKIGVGLLALSFAGSAAAFSLGDVAAKVTGAVAPTENKTARDQRPQACIDANINVREVPANTGANGDRQAVVRNEKTGKTYLLTEGPQTGSSTAVPLGAFAGAIAGRALAKEKEDKSIATVGGAVVGTLAGLGVNKYKDSKREDTAAECVRVVAGQGEAPALGGQ